MSKKPIADFRTAEMQKEIADKRKEVERMERELTKHQHAAV